MWLTTTMLDSLGLDSGGILHDTGGSCKLPLATAWAHLAILCDFRE